MGGRSCGKKRDWQRVRRRKHRKFCPDVRSIPLVFQRFLYLRLFEANAGIFDFLSDTGCFILRVGMARTGVMWRSWL